jgi:hypothetical protein
VSETGVMFIDELYIVSPDLWRFMVNNQEKKMTGHNEFHKNKERVHMLLLQTNLRITAEVMDSRFMEGFECTREAQIKMNPLLTFHKVSELNRVIPTEFDWKSPGKEPEVVAGLAEESGFEGIELSLKSGLTVDKATLHLSPKGAYAFEMLAEKIPSFAFIAGKDLLIEFLRTIQKGLEPLSVIFSDFDSKQVGYGLVMFEVLIGGLAGVMGDAEIKRMNNYVPGVFIPCHILAVLPEGRKVSLTPPPNVLVPIDILTAAIEMQYHIFNIIH